MSERTRNGKNSSQDPLGFLLCLVGGFFAVSIVLHQRGQEPKPGFISSLTWPVLEEIVLLGASTALLFSVGLAALGVVLFLRTTSFSALRPLVSLFLGALGMASILGAFELGGTLGGWLPGLVLGFVGRGLALVLGTATAWLAWTLFAGQRAPRGSSADLVQRVGLAAHHDATSGVSPAEAALLVSDARPLAARPAPRREPELRDETIRPYTPAREAPSEPARAARVTVPSAPARTSAETPPLVPAPATVAARGAPVLTPASAAPISVMTPPAPSWETEAAGEVLEETLEEELDEFEELEEHDEEEELDEELDEEEGTAEEGPASSLTATLSAAFETEEATASEIEALTAPASASEALVPPRASWEQIGLFDEEEELEEEAPPALAKVELTPTFDFEASEPPRAAHEPEPPREPAARAPTAPVEPPVALEEPREEEEEEEELEADEPPDAGVAAMPELVVRAAPPPPAPVPQAAPTPRPEPGVARDEDGERWSQLVFEAGCMILEQKRVAVSMLERRFSIDFDQACRVLDELQQAGLIGPYMGGRTRDILLTREEWLPHAPHAG